MATMITLVTIVTNLVRNIGLEVTLWTCIREGIGSNLDRQTSYPE
jgi:hypothetical protein